MTPAFSLVSDFTLSDSAWNKKAAQRGGFPCGIAFIPGNLSAYCR
jgi:hypothetical protein